MDLEGLFVEICFDALVLEAFGTGGFGAFLPLFLLEAGAVSSCSSLSSSVCLYCKARFKGTAAKEKMNDQNKKKRMIRRNRKRIPSGILVMIRVSLANCSFDKANRRVKLTSGLLVRKILLLSLILSRVGKLPALVDLPRNFSAKPKRAQGRGTGFGKGI